MVVFSPFSTALRLILFVLLPDLRLSARVSEQERSMRAAEPPPSSTDRSRWADYPRSSAQPQRDGLRTAEPAPSAGPRWADFLHNGSDNAAAEDDWLQMNFDTIFHGRPSKQDVVVNGDPVATSGTTSCLVRSNGDNILRRSTMQKSVSFKTDSTASARCEDAHMSSNPQESKMPKPVMAFVK